MKYLITLLFFSFCQITFGQNLVPNPSFEDTITCPLTLADFKAKNWQPIENTPDYFNSCNSVIITQSCSVPQNLLTNRNAATGYAYCGLVNYLSWLPNGREKLGIKLIDTLKIGKRYYLSFKSSAVESWRYDFQNGATNNLGFLFSTKQYDLLNLSPTNNFCHFKSDSIIKDTIGWELIQGSFIADSAYTYLYIGVFYDDNHLDTTRFFTNPLNPMALRCYTFIDDIYVGYDSTQDVGMFTSADLNLSVYPNPTSNIINVATNNSEIEQIEIFNAVGIREKEVFHPPIQAVLKIDISNLANGIYILKITNKNTIASKKINVIH